jgi:putative ubiquitin-RnfH superfamily antitoxin RatB of RatAB toxin-antitoxin module
MARLRVEVVEALATRAVRVALELEAGATVRAALAASGRAAQEPVGIHGRRVSLDTPLADGDRVEIYRALQVDPKQARRQRALRRAR